MLSKNHQAILFIDRFGFCVYQDVLANIPKFSFTPDLVSNMDVVNREQFASLISTFIQINKMVPGSLTVALSDNVICIKDLENSVQKPVPAQGLKTDLNDDKDHGDEVQSFLENIPFEEILAKVIKVGNANRIVACNKDLVMTITDSFASKGFIIEGIIPGFMYGQKANFTAGLTMDNIRVILEDAEFLRTGNLLTDQEKMISSNSFASELKSLPSTEAKKSQSLRQYILVGVFVTLLVILAVVYLNMGAAKTPPKSSKVKNASLNTVNAPTAQPTLTQSLITSSPVDIKSIKIKITQSSQTTEEAINLRSNLLNIGLQDIVSEISEVSIPEKSSVIFSQNIPADLRNDIVTEVRKILPGISILENQESDSAVSILIGKS